MNTLVVSGYLIIPLVVYRYFIPHPADFPPVFELLMIHGGFNGPIELAFGLEADNNSS